MERNGNGMELAEIYSSASSDSVSSVVLAVRPNSLSTPAAVVPLQAVCSSARRRHP